MFNTTCSGAAGTGSNYCGISDDQFCIDNPSHPDCSAASSDSSSDSSGASSDSGESSSGSGEPPSSGSGGEDPGLCEQNPEHPYCDGGGDLPPGLDCSETPNDPRCQSVYSSGSSDANPSSGSGSDSSSGSGEGGQSSGGGSGDGPSSGSGSGNGSSSPGGGTPGSSSGSGSGNGSDTSGVAGAGCKDLKDCDWSTYEEQLKQTGISREILAYIKDLFPWLQRKAHEDSLLAAARWLGEKEGRERMVEISETISGRIFTYYSNASAHADSNLRALQRIDSLNGVYHFGALSASSANARAIDSLHAFLSGVLGGGSGGDYPSFCLLPSNRHLPECGGSGGGSGGTDLSGVEGGISGLGGLLRKIDSTLSAGNADVTGFLGGECDGDGCGDYSGIGDGAFGGLDTSGLGKARWDSLLSPPGGGGLKDSVLAFAGDLREKTQTPFYDGMECPSERLSADPCSAVGGSCPRSLCDPVFYVMGRHVLEWFGVFIEFAAWLFLLVRIA